MAGSKATAEAEALGRNSARTLARREEPTYLRISTLGGVMHVLQCRRSAYSWRLIRLQEIIWGCRASHLIVLKVPTNQDLRSPDTVLHEFSTPRGTRKKHGLGSGGTYVSGVRKHDDARWVS
jgi:hypothetical protein